MKAYIDRIKEAKEEAYGVMVNSFQELEEEYAEECKKVTGRKVWCIGLVSLYKKENLDEAQRGSKNHSNDENQYCLKWLDSQKPGSVMYDCLGSLNRLTPPHLAEFRLGLEASKRAFIWVMRDGYRKEEIENWLVEDGFEERVKEQGLLIPGWASQKLILSHPAIGDLECS